MPQENKYIKLNINSLGSWNPDSDIGSVPPNQFSEVRNLRQIAPGDYVLRSGYNDLSVFNNGVLGVTAELLCTTEYKFIANDNSVTLFEIVAVFDDNNIKLFGINRSPIDQTPPSPYWANQFSKNVLRNADDTATLVIVYEPEVEPVRAYMTQYGADIILTVYGLGVYAIYPTDNNPDKWTVRLLGKDRAGIPNQSMEMSYANEYNGDLFIVLYDDRVDEKVNGNRYAHHMTPKKLVAGQETTSIFPPLQYIRVPLNAKYYNSEQHSEFIGWPLRNWVFSKNDPAISNQDVRAVTHLQTRAWGYRFVYVHKYLDGRGNTITYRSAPSTDIWVPDKIYCPPQVFAKETADNNTANKRMQQYRSGIWTQPVIDVALPADRDASYFVFSNEYGTQGKYPTIPLPDATAVQSLGEAIIAYNAQSYQYKNNASAGTKWSEGSTNIDENTFLASMYWVGFWRAWWEGGSTATLFTEEFNFDGDIDIPYFVEVPASQLASAPLLNLKWSYFDDIPDDVVEIEIYRTAYNDSNLTIDKDGVTQPLYETHEYGYAGSLKRPLTGDSVFLDDVKDEELIFSSQPEDNDGLLAADFSGAVVAEYNRHLVIGDIETTYRIFSPWAQYQAFVYGPGSGERSELTYFGGDSFFALQYVDTDGNTSVPTTYEHCGYTSSESGDTTWGSVAAVVAAGYAPNIVSINFLFFDATDVDPANWTYRIVKQIKPEDGFAIATREECLAGSATTATGSGSIDTKEPGAIIWTNPADIFTIGPTNYLNAHPSSTVTALASIMGELYVYSYSGVILTNLDRRFEELNKEVGCIGRFTISKLDKIVFHLTASGLYFTEASGIVSFPGFVESFVRQYLNENIPEVPLLTNGKRAALGYFNKFRELWLYLPGSHDLGNYPNFGSLRARLVVYKFFGDLYSEGAAALQKGFINYEVEILDRGNPGYQSGVPDGSQAHTLPVLFTEHSDGSLYSEFKDINNDTFHSVDNDFNTVFGGNWALEKPLGMLSEDDNSLIVKILRAVRHSGNAVGDVFVRCGAPVSDGIPQYDTGLVWTPSTNYPYSVTDDGIGEMFNHRIPWDEVAQSTHEVPIIRWSGTPNSDFDQNILFTGIKVFVEPLHDHPD